jgi:biopolymer transport protein ExbB/TolQ
VLDSQFVHQYFASHPVEYIATTLFFVGLAVLGIKLLEVTVPSQDLGQNVLGGVPRAGDAVDQCQALMARLEKLPAQRQRGFFAERIRNGLQYVLRSGSPDGLDEELRYLADLDAHRVHSSYGLVRMIIWAIPILGFLGTVIGIALAIGKLAPQALEDSLPEVMAGLTVAFNTTALALGLSMVLMFALFLTERKENALLAEVDHRVEAELIGRFPSGGAQSSGDMAAVRTMADKVIGTAEELVQRQSRLWEQTIRAAEERWSSLTDDAGVQLSTALTAAMSESLKAHARELAGHEQLYAEKNRQNWQETQKVLAANTQALATSHQAAAEKLDILARAVGATDQVAKLEETLNRNLQALAGSKNFEETVMSLAAAIHLLNARLGEVPSAVSTVQLDTPRRGHAA